LSGALLWMLVAAASAEPSVELQALVTGRFELAEPSAEYEPRLDASVDAGLSALPAILAPLARLRLKPAVYATVCPEIILGLDPERLDVSCGGEQAPFSRRLDGSDGPVMDSTGAYEVSIEYGQRWVSMRMAGQMGGQGYRYEFPPEGGMVLHATIFSRFLPDDLVWTLGYRRVDQGS
jgi:hypothetical protein